MKMNAKISSPPVSSIREIEFDTIAFFGRTLKDYESFLELDRKQLAGCRILDCAAGSASFTAEANRIGIESIAVDPMYSRPASALKRLATLDFQQVIVSAEKVPERFVFRCVRSLEDLRQRRQQALDLFLEDYPSGRAAGRYVSGALPFLPFTNHSFHSAHCGHFLFLYGDRLDYSFHFEACRELCRVARHEVRIYPLQGMDGQRYGHLDRLLRHLQHVGIASEIRKIDYEFLRGSNELLILEPSKA